MLPIASTDVTLPTHKETSVSLSLSFVCTCRSVCIMMYVLCDVFIIMLLDHYGGHSPFKNFILLCDILLCKFVTNNTLFIPSVVSVLLWVCVVVQWAVLWDQWNALCDTSL